MVSAVEAQFNIQRPFSWATRLPLGIKSSCAPPLDRWDRYINAFMSTTDEAVEASGGVVCLQGACAYGQAVTLFAISPCRRCEVRIVTSANLFAKKMACYSF